MFASNLGAIFQPFSISGMNSDENSDSDSEYELDQIEENYEPMNEEEHPQYASYPLEKKRK